MVAWNRIWWCSCRKCGMVSWDPALQEEG